MLSEFEFLEYHRLLRQSSTRPASYFKSNPPGRKTGLSDTRSWFSIGRLSGAHRLPLPYVEGTKLAPEQTTTLQCALVARKASPSTPLPPLSSPIVATMSRQLQSGSFLRVVAPANRATGYCTSVGDVFGRVWADPTQISPLARC
jgi:hypothetical protein